MENQVNTSVNKSLVVQEPNFKSDERLNYFKDYIVRASEDFLSSYYAKQKINQLPVDLEAESKQLLDSIRSAVDAYAQNFVEMVDVEVSPEQVDAEFTQLTARITALESDPDIRRIEVMPEFKRLKERVKTLESLSSKIKVLTNTIVNDNTGDVQPAGVQTE